MKQTQLESYRLIQEKAPGMYNYILKLMQDGQERSAKEIAVSLFEFRLTDSTERNKTHPRLKELIDMGLIEEDKTKRKCKYTGRMVTTYKITEAGKERIRSIA